MEQFYLYKNKQWIEVESKEFIKNDKYSCCINTCLSLLYETLENKKFIWHGTHFDKKSLIRRYYWKTKFLL